MRRCNCLVYGILLLFMVTGGAYAQNRAETEIRQILAKQTAAWNEGNLAKFMIGYWNHDSLLFVGETGPTYGYQTTLENYKKGYPDKAAMGKLSFQIIQLKPLAANYYFVLGKWMLQRTIGNVSGHYTLLFRKIKGQWLIVVDHSS